MQQQLEAELTSVKKIIKREQQQIKLLVHIIRVVRGYAYLHVGIILKFPFFLVLFAVCVSVHMCVCLCMYVCVCVGRSAGQRQGVAAATKTTGNLHLRLCDS